MLGLPGPGVSSSKPSPPQLTLDLLAWMLENISLGSPTRKQAVPSTCPELTSQERAEGSEAPGPLVPVPCRNLTAGREWGLQLPQPR